MAGYAGTTSSGGPKISDGSRAIVKYEPRPAPGSDVAVVLAVGGRLSTMGELDSVSD